MDPNGCPNPNEHPDPNGFTHYYGDGCPEHPLADDPALRNPNSCAKPAPKNPHLHLDTNPPVCYAVPNCDGTVAAYPKPRRKRDSGPEPDASVKW